MTRTDGLLCMTDRYEFDFHACNASGGWSQMDTRQDASYHGIWINPLSLELCSYVEGDTSYVKCDTPEEFVDEVASWADWQIEHGYFVGIDDMCRPEIDAAFRSLGLERYLYA